MSMVADKIIEMAEGIESGIDPRVYLSRLICDTKMEIWEAAGMVGKAILMAQEWREDRKDVELAASQEVVGD